MSEGREPPFNLEAERSVLGAVLLAPDVLDDVLGTLTGDDFYLPAHRDLFAAIQALVKRRVPVDVIALSDELQARGVLARLDGGTAFLTGLAAGVPSVENVDFYARAVKGKSTLRQLIATCNDVAAAAYAGEEQPTDLLDRIVRDVMAMSSGRRTSLVSIRSLIDGVMDAIEARAGATESPTCLPTGFAAWDFMTAGGLRNGTLNILAARPSVGKTSCARCVASNVASPSVGADALVFSLEESRDDMVEKWLVAGARVDNQSVRRGSVSGPNWMALQKSASDLAASGILIDDANGRENNIGRIWSKVRQWRARNPDRRALVVIDYLQLAEVAPSTNRSERRRENRATEVAEITRDAKAMAKECDLPVLALSQLNREVEKDNRRPRLSDLRESGAIEQDADQVIFLHAESSTPSAIAAGGVVEGIIAKNRSGPTGAFKMAWLASYGRFENLADDSFTGQERLPYSDR